MTKEIRNYPRWGFLSDNDDPSIGVPICNFPGSLIDGSELGYADGDAACLFRPDEKSRLHITMRQIHSIRENEKVLVMYDHIMEGATCMNLGKYPSLWL